MATSIGYEVIFSLENLTLYEQEKIYQILIKNLSFDQKSKLKIKVIDPVNGTHFVFEDRGIQPNGTECKVCKRVDCRNCFKAESW